MTTKVEQAVLMLGQLPQDRAEEIADIIIRAGEPVIQWSESGHDKTTDPNDTVERLATVC